MGRPTAVSRWERVDRRQRSYRSMNVTQVFDGLGNVVREERGPETAGVFAPAVS